MILRPEAQVEVLDVRENDDGLHVEDKAVDLALRVRCKHVFVMRPLSILREDKCLQWWVSHAAISIK